METTALSAWFYHHRRRPPALRFHCAPSSPEFSLCSPSAAPHLLFVCLFWRPSLLSVRPSVCSQITWQVIVVAVTGRGSPYAGAHLQVPHPAAQAPQFIPRAPASPQTQMMMMHQQQHGGGGGPAAVYPSHFGSVVSCAIYYTFLRLPKSIPKLLRFFIQVRVHKMHCTVMQLVVSQPYSVLYILL